MKTKLNNIFDLQDKVIVITGAAGLLGKKHAEAIAAFGGIPILLDLSQGEVTKVAEQLNDQYGVKSMGFAVDITNETQVAENVNLLVEEYGKIDGLVNNAANNPKMEDDKEKNFTRLENFLLDAWNQDIAVGLTGAFLCAKHYGYQISKNPLGGSIVNISSDLGVIAPDQRLYMQDGLPNEKQNVKPITYSVVKSGMIGLTKYLATYWTDKNVRCNAMCPGGIKNNQSEEFLNRVKSRIPMNRLAESDEYQSTLLWMLSDASSYLNGSIISVDGGRSVW
jgi:NAD(P)-dependent dehydrogenase (short-subunit alcohol dehydrogenase family)